MLVIALAGTVFLAIISILIPPETSENRADRLQRAWRCAAIGIVALLLALGAYSLFLSNHKWENLDPLTAEILIAAGGMGLFAVFAIFVGICAELCRITANKGVGVVDHLTCRARRPACTLS